MAGSAAANALVINGSATEIDLVDRDEKRAAEAEGILHATAFTNIVTVRAGGYGDLDAAEVVIIAIGVLSLPRVVGRGGISSTIWPSLTRDEHVALRRSAEVIVEAAGG